MLARDLSLGQSQLTKLKTEDDRVVASKPKIMMEIEKFYGQLYTTIRPLVENLANDTRARLTQNYSDDILDDSFYEIRMVLKQLKNHKAPGDVGITSELLKAGGTPMLIYLQKLFNSVIFEGVTPKACNRSVVVLFFFKKGDKTLLKIL